VTDLLAQAFQKASELPENSHDEMAGELLEEIEWESRRDQTLADSQGKIDGMAQKALDEYRSGKTTCQNH
jgi:hypothetical protein